MIILYYVIAYITTFTFNTFIYIYFKIIYRKDQQKIVLFTAANLLNLMLYQYSCLFTAFAAENNYFLPEDFPFLEDFGLTPDVLGCFTFIGFLTVFIVFSFSISERAENIPAGIIEPL